MRSLAFAALVALVLCFIHSASSTNSQAIFIAMDQIDSALGLGFRSKYGDPQKTCNCSFVRAGSGEVFTCLWTRVGASGNKEGFFCGLTDTANPQIDSIILDSPVPAAPGANIPSALGQITSLRQLLIRNAGLSGTIPSELNRLTNLQTLIIANNALALGIPDFSALQSLTKLSLSNNGLIGDVPQNISLLVGLKELYLDNNRFTGPATFISPLRALTLLRLENNQFSGDIPDAVGTLPKLTHIYLSNNLFTGNVPASFATLAAKHCDVQLNDVNLCWDPIGLQQNYAPSCQFNCRPCENGFNGPPSCTCWSVQPNPAHCDNVNGSNPLNIAWDKVVVNGTITQSTSGVQYLLLKFSPLTPIRIWVSGDEGAGGITSSGCSTLQGPVYVDLHDVKSAYTLDAVKSTGGCINGNFSRVVVTDNDGPNCPREGAFAKSNGGSVSIIVGSSDGCVGPAQSNDGPRITKPILIGIITGSVAVGLAVIGVVLLVVFIKKTANSSRVY